MRRVKREKASQEPRQDAGRVHEPRQYSPTGNCQKEGGGCVCGQHTLEDLLTLDHEESSNNWLKRKRMHESGAENIAEHCVMCGIRF